MKAVIACAFILVYPVISSSSLDSHKPGCRVPEDYCGPRWIGNDRDTQLRCVVPLGWVCYKNVTTVIIITTYPVIPTHTLLLSIPSKERSRAKPELKPLVPTPHYSGRLDLIESIQSSTGKVKFCSYRIINYYRPNLQDTTYTSVYATVCSKKFNKDVVPPDSTSKESSYVSSDSPETPIQTTITGVASSPSPQPSITSIRSVLFDAASHLHDIIPFTTPPYAVEDGTTCPTVPGPDDVTKPILEVTCVDRTRLFWSDFKITWSAAWNDQRGCHKLFCAMERRGPVTGWSCKQAADNNGYIMQARGHRPRSPRRLVADAIREAFELENTLYYHGYETRLLCEKMA